jgi:hypothetical protein
MRILFYFAAALLSLSCLQSPLYSEYKLVMPVLPAEWTEVLGDIKWHIEWVDKSGKLLSANTNSNFYRVDNLMEEWANPILAYPYIVRSGILKPGGAIFPYDAKDDVVTLSWQGGIDAFFYRELISPDEKRRPQYFDWKRFRALFTEKTLNQSVLNDPWIVDWKMTALKTLESGFNSRRIVPKETYNLIINIPAAGPWISTSPFAGVYNWKKDNPAAIQVTDSVEHFFCPQGELRCKKDIFVFEAYE